MKSISENNLEELKTALVNDVAMFIEAASSERWKIAEGKIRRLQGNVFKSLTLLEKLERDLSDIVYVQLQKQLEGASQLLNDYPRIKSKAVLACVEYILFHYEKETGRKSYLGYRHVHREPTDASTILVHDVMSEAIAQVKVLSKSKIASHFMHSHNDHYKSAVNRVLEKWKKHGKPKDTEFFILDGNLDQWD